MADERRRVDIGFSGGQVLALRLDQKAYDSIRTALGGEDRFVDVETGDSKLTLDLTQVVYLRLDTEDHRVGF